MINQLPICDFSQDVILCSQPMDMDQHSIRNVMSPVNKFDAVNKACADRIKYKTPTVNIPNMPENISGHFGLLFLRVPYKFQFYFTLLTLLYIIRSVSKPSSHSVSGP